MFDLHTVKYTNPGGADKVKSAGLYKLNCSYGVNTYHANAAELCSELDKNDSRYSARKRCSGCNQKNAGST